MSEYVNLHRVVSYLEEEGHVMEFKEFKTTFEDKVRQESLTENVLLTALRLQKRDMQHDSKILSSYLQRGDQQDQQVRLLRNQVQSEVG